jgi:hypothetical protein
MDETGGYHIKWSKPFSEGQRLTVFPHMLKLDLKDKCIHKCMCDLIYMEAIHTVLYIFTYRGRKKERAWL